MAIDGCEHGFTDLARRVLPAYMETLRQGMASPFPLQTFGERGNGPVTLARLHGFAGDVKGCYVILDSDRPIYVGISRHCFERLLEHVRPGDHFTATLAYQMARAHHPFSGSAKEAMADDGFRGQFDREREYILGLNAAVVEIANPLERYVFEAYCALELGTGEENGGWNTFETH